MIIPIFLPELACPGRCVFCNQFLISGQKGVPDESEIGRIIERNLSTRSAGIRQVEIAFYGGSFTLLSLQEQQRLLAIAGFYVKSGNVDGIRISTRPDAITVENLQLLSANHVSQVELGAQSFDDEVLRASGRGYNSDAIEVAAQKIREAGLELGIQLMIGLPADTLSKALDGARRVVGLGAHTSRIYPALVVEDTALARMWRAGEFQPLSINAAVSWIRKMRDILYQGRVKILRIGLHPSLDLQSSALLAGPYHPGLRQLVEAARWRAQFLRFFYPKSGVLGKNRVYGEPLTIQAHPDMMGFLVGPGGINKKFLSRRFRKVVFMQDDRLIGEENTGRWRYSYGQVEEEILFF